MCAQSCLTLWDPMNHSPPSSSIHGIFQARIVEWVAITYSRGSSQPRDQTLIFNPMSLDSQFCILTPSPRGEKIKKCVYQTYLETAMMISCYQMRMSPLVTMALEPLEWHFS